MSNPLVLVVGAGPGVGGSVARRFGREGYDAALVSRSESQLAALGEQLEGEGIAAQWQACDVTDDPALREVVTGFGTRAGRIDVLHFNPSAFTQKDPLELSADELVADVRLGVGGLLTAVQAARPFLHRGSRVLATGSRAADRPWNQAASLGVQKAGLRNLVRSVDATLRGEGVRAVSVTVNGTLEKGTAFDPDLVAEAIFTAARQPEDHWRTEVPYDG